MEAQDLRLIWPRLPLSSDEYSAECPFEGSPSRHQPFAQSKGSVYLLAAFKRITEQRESRKSEVAPRQRAHELLPSPSGVERQDGLQADDLLLQRERNPGSGPR